MKFSGALKKMNTLAKNPVKYSLELGEDMLNVNALIHKELSFNFTGKHLCICGKIVDNVYRGNFCRECYFSHPAAGDAIFRPELSQAHLGIADRDLAFEEKYQLQPHVVYLANSGGTKVGVTRLQQKQHRWMDQGANSAIVLAETPNRFEAGRVEVALKDFISDKTNWRKMLKNEFEEIDLPAEKVRLAAELDRDLQAFISDENEVYQFNYPVENYPAKVTSINLKKNPDFTGKLAGIKGQYLLFENGLVMNVRSHEGFLVSLDVR